ncbi:MAG: DUF6468 domain-containing protein [Pseudomonadota bacterium]
MVILGLLFDIVMTGLLAATIFFAVRLSRDLDTFRTTRNDMAQAMQDIATHVTKAQSAVEELRLHAGQSAINLQALITQADQVSRELELVTQAGDALATRLEGAASLRAKDATPSSQSFTDVMDTVVPDRPYQSRGDSLNGPAFTIYDREYNNADGDADPSATDGYETENDDDNGFFSQAERDLATVLNKRRSRR